MDIHAYIRRSRRKSLAIEVDPEGQVIIRAPFQMPEEEIRSFATEKREWIAKQVLRRQKEAEDAKAGRLTKQELRRIASETRTLVAERAPHFAAQLGVSYGKVTIRRVRTRWGSCSSKGNLNFNCLLALCPSEVADYVIVHELCHRIEMNHSPAFWALVESQLPSYRESRRWLKENGNALIRRLPEEE